ncbi:MAG: NapC/NirT family cytochrome c, partial [Gammaproteobacteria bacterium]
MYRHGLLIPPLILVFVAGIVGGLLVALSMEKVDQLTSTDAFCGNSCHAMEAYVAYEPIYLNSQHRTTFTGIQAGCADCHIPKGLLKATWTHAVSGVRDTWSLLVNDFSTRKAWNSRREEMAGRVRDRMLENDSETCRSCHEQAALKPRRESGVRRHQLAQRKNITCIACHYNLVHEPIEAQPDFLRRAGVWPQPS